MKINNLNTVNVVIFAGGKFREKCWRDITRGVIFHYTTPISFIKAYGFYFSRGGNFREEDKSAKKKNKKITPHENFHVYSKQINILPEWSSVSTNNSMNFGRIWNRSICDV